MFADATLRRPGFLGRRDAETGRRGAVVLEFGDHQSSATKPFVDAVAGEDALARPESLAYRTFYTLSTFSDPLRHPMPLDVGFLGASLLDAAGPPMSPMMIDLVRLRDHCGGRCASAAARQFGVAASLPAGAASQPRRTTPVGGGQPLMSQVIGVDPSVATVFSAPSSMSPFSSFSAASRRRRIQSAASSLPLSRSSADSTRSNFDWARACVSL